MSCLIHRSAVIVTHPVSRKAPVEINTPVISSTVPTNIPLLDLIGTPILYHCLEDPNFSDFWSPLLPEASTPTPLRDTSSF